MRSESECRWTRLQGEEGHRLEMSTSAWYSEVSLHGVQWEMSKTGFLGRAGHLPFIRAVSWWGKSDCKRDWGRRACSINQVRQPTNSRNRSDFQICFLPRLNEHYGIFAQVLFPEFQTAEDKNLSDFQSRSMLGRPIDQTIEEVNLSITAGWSFSW